MKAITMPPRLWAVSISLISLVILGVISTGCMARHNLHPDNPMNNKNVQDRASSIEPLFLHFLSPWYYTQPPIPPRRIISTRICLGEDFTLSGAPSGYPHVLLAGRVEQRGTNYFARLSGNDQRFQGLMDLNKIYESQGGGFSGAIRPVRFVLSTNLDCSVFVKQLERESGNSETEPTDPPNDGPATSVENSDASGGGRPR